MTASPKESWLDALDRAAAGDFAGLEQCRALGDPPAELAVRVNNLLQRAERLRAEAEAEVERVAASIGGDDARAVATAWLNAIRRARERDPSLLARSIARHAAPPALREQIAQLVMEAPWRDARAGSDPRRLNDVDREAIRRALTLRVAVAGEDLVRTIEDLMNLYGIEDRRTIERAAGRALLARLRAQSKASARPSNASRGRTKR